MSGYDAVIFDLDGTLCQSEQDVEVAYRRAFESVGVEPFAEPADLWAALDGAPDPDDRVRYLAAGFARLAAQHDAEADPATLASSLLDAFDRSQVAFLPDAADLLEDLAERYRLGVLTNGPQRYQEEKVDTLGLETRVDAVVYAGDLPRRKPLSPPFEAICERLSVTPERALYVGDSLRYDVAGAHVSGLDVAWFAPDGESPDPYAPTYVLRSLADLSTVLD